LKNIGKNSIKKLSASRNLSKRLTNKSQGIKTMSIVKSFLNKWMIPTVLD